MLVCGALFFPSSCVSVCGQAMEMFGVSIVSWTGLSGVGMGGVQPALPLSPHICKREQ